ncbi:MAG: ribonuclease HI [bacterium]
MNKIIIFSDGSSKGNPGPGGWGAVVAQGNKVIELGGGEKHTTNNRMELLAAISGLFSLGSPAPKSEEIVLNTDSSYVINGITKWVYGWQKNGWKNSEKANVSNRDLWEQLIKVSRGMKIKWNYVGGHSGVSCNERCDAIATSFADLPEKILPDGKSNIFPALDKKSNASGKTLAGEVKIKLFKGKFSDYKYDLLDIKGCGIKKKSKSQNKLPAYSYLSLVNGVFHKNKTWAECEKRVKGIKGNVKFRKSVSPEDEKVIIKGWGMK